MVITKKEDLISFKQYGWHKGFYHDDSITESLSKIKYTEFFDYPDNDDFPYDSAFNLLYGSCNHFALSLKNVFKYTPYIIEGNYNKSFHAFCQIYKTGTWYYIDARGITLLAQETKGKQISWEHTSLIGEFYLNPNTIFDGTNYSSDALEDSQYVFDRGSKIGIIVEGLKSYVWNLQNNAVCKIRNVDFKTVRADDLFVLGRNLYQATCGSSFTAQRFIDDFSNISYIPNEAKEHILNGMVYEVYYDRNEKLRENFKWNYAEKVIEYVESEAFYNSCRFISTRLYIEEGKIFYVPGQNEKVEVSVDLLDKDDCDSVSDIKCKGISIYYDAYTGIKPVIDDIYAEIPKNQFEAELRRKMGVMPGYLKIDYHGVENDPKMKFLIPINGYITFPQYRDD